MEIKQIIDLLREAYDEGLTLSVTYTNSYDETNEYEIWDIKPDSDYGSGNIDRRGYIKAYCGYKDDDECDEYYTFKISRYSYVETID